jgi:hypothetical protein
MENKTLWQIREATERLHFLLLTEPLRGSPRLTIATTGPAILQFSAFLFPQETDRKIRLLIYFLKRRCHLKLLPLTSCNTKTLT